MIQLRFFILFCCVLFIMACQGERDSYRITGEISGLPEGIKISLIPGATHRQEKPIAETVVRNGQFVLEGSVEGPRLFYIVAEGYRGAESVMVENRQIRIKGNFSVEGSGEESVARFDDFKVEGSPLNDSLLLKRKVREELDQLFSANRKRHEATSQELGRLRMTGNRDSLRLFMESAAYRQMAEDEKNFFDQVEKQYRKTIAENAASWWGAFMMMDLFSYLTEEQKSWYESLSSAAKESYYGQLVKAELFPETLEGKEAPSFIASDRDGKAYNLKELLAGKKYLLVDFWASWCGPCRKFIPQMKAVYEQYKDKGLNMVGISWDKDPKAWVKALDEEKMPWINLLGQDDIFNEYDVRTIPSIFIIDAEGKIRGAKLHGESLMTKLEELFN